MSSDPEFSVDRFQLEKEAQRQPALMKKYTKLLGRYKGILKDEQRRLRILEGELSEEYRRNKKAYGIQKDTDGVIFRLIEGDPAYERQFRKVQRAQSNFYSAESAVASIEQRGWMIKELVKLWLNNYYSKITVKEQELKPKRIKLEQGD